MQRTSNFSPLRHAVQVLCVILIASGCAGQSAPVPAATPDPIVARIGDAPITLSEVDEQIKNSLFEEQFGGNYRARLFDARSEAVNQMIDTRLLADAARTANLSTDAWIAQQVAGLEPISDEEVASFFEANRQNIGEGITLDEMSGRIKQHLVAQQEKGVLLKLREGKRIAVELSRERFDVEAVGHARGPEDARVTIVEFSDYQCPFCARAEPTIQKLLERYPDDIRLVYRHLPLDFHSNALGASQAAVCADAQGRFWEYHALLFGHQDALDANALAGYANQLGLDAEAFAACLDAPETVAWIHRDIAAAKNVGATGTPAFYINGIFLSGAQPLERFEAMLAAEGVEIVP
jgi:predicted DsbA family dithiol-disulfide isomerase